jgi:hypothetical protein
MEKGLSGVFGVIGSGLDVPGILQELTSRASAGKGLERSKWGQSGGRKKSKKTGLGNNAAKPLI